MQNHIKKNLDFEAYRADPAISQSDLKNLSKCPSYYEYKKHNECSTEAMRFGRMAHTYILENSKFFEEYFITKKVRRGTKAWDEVLEKSEGKEVVFIDEVKKFEDLRANLIQNDYFSSLMQTSDKEVSFFWEDPDTKVQCKGRADGFCEKTRVIFDVKTACDCSEKAFKSQLFNFKYYLQAAFYSDGIKEVCGTAPTAFVFFVIEKNPPYLNTTYFIDYKSDVIEAGRDEYKSLLTTYQKCCEAETFDTGLEKRVIKIDSMPKWYNFDGRSTL